MDKKIFKKLLSLKIISTEQASEYINLKKQVSLKEWLLKNNYIQIDIWDNLIRSNVAEKESGMPNSFSMEISPTAPTDEHKIPRKELKMSNSFSMEISPTAPTDEYKIPQKELKMSNSFSMGTSISAQTEEYVLPKSLEINNNKMFRNYLIQEKLGEGGMGIVYKAIDTISQREVAIKMIRANLITEESNKRFLQEVRAVSRMNHPNIIRLFEVGQTPTPYFTMEYIKSVTLKEALKKKHVSNPRQIAKIFAKIANALEHAHKMGIIHRDIKPENILLTKKNEPKIMDFGLAKNTEIQNSISRTGNILGTPAFLPPEQAEGGKIDARADVYSLGATLYQALVGHPPFREDSYVSLFYDIMHEPPVPPRKLNDKVPVDLEAICLKCLEKKPEMRYATAEDLEKDLQNYIDHLPIKAKVKNSTWHKMQFFKLWKKRKALCILLLLNISLFFVIFFTKIIENNKKYTSDKEKIVNVITVFNKKELEHIKIIIKEMNYFAKINDVKLDKIRRKKIKEYVFKKKKPKKDDPKLLNWITKLEKLHHNKEKNIFLSLFCFGLTKEEYLTASISAVPKNKMAYLELINMYYQWGFDEQALSICLLLKKQKKYTLEINMWLEKIIKTKNLPQKKPPFENPRQKAKQLHQMVMKLKENKLSNSKFKKAWKKIDISFKNQYLNKSKKIIGGPHIKKYIILSLVELLELFLLKINAEDNDKKKIKNRLQQRHKEVEKSYIFNTIKGNYSYEREDYIEAIIYWEKAINIFPATRSIWLEQQRKAKYKHEQRNKGK